MTASPFRLRLPKQQRSPVVFASPHSGRAYGDGFVAASVLGPLALRSSEDAFVDELFAAVPDLGAPFLLADTPRAYVDLNRAPDELDPALIEGVGRAPHNPRVSSGIGVIPRVVAGGRAIYAGKMPLSEAEKRLRAHWYPYHAALRDLIETTHRRFGEAILVDLHSMPHEAIANHIRPGQPRPDVVLGDRFGAAAGAQVADLIESAFRDAGLRVARNAPFAGAFIAQSYGRPVSRRHVVQIEIDRGLYMTESTLQKLPAFDDLCALLAGVAGRIIAGFAPPATLAAE